jgi:hypothetical protein
VVDREPEVVQRAGRLELAKPVRNGSLAVESLAVRPEAVGDYHVLEA